MKCQRTMMTGLVAILFVVERVGALAANLGIARPEATLLQLLAKPFAPTEGASAECIRDSQIYFAELRNYNPWALQMYDSSAKISPGVITGNIQQLGNFDECLRIKTGQNFNVQACSASVQFEILKGAKKSDELDMKDLLIQVAKASNMKIMPDKTVDYEWMWCVPSSCNYTEISEAIELALDPLKVDDRLDFVVNINANSCQTTSSDRYFFDAVDWFYVNVLLTFAGVIIISTSYDLRTKNRIEETKRKEPKHVLLTSFSLYTNGKRILNTKRSSDSITCLDGLRYLCICWIIFGHTFYLEAVGVKIDRSSITQLHKDWSSMLVLNGNIITDAFFLISGILLAYTSMAKSSEQAKESISVFQLYLHRYLRLTPAYAIIVGFYSTFFDKLGSGPKWNAWITTSKHDCRANWWTNILYINNYVNIGNICMSQSWYLSVDMQLLWISPIFLYPMIKFNRSTFFWIVTSIGLLISVLLPFFITYFMQLTGTMLYYKSMKDVEDVYLQIYTRVYTRAGPYIIGLALGYILFKTKGYKIRVKRIFVCCGWIIALTAGFLVFALPREMYSDDYAYNKWEASFYAGFHRHVFVLAISWIIFACINGYAGPINSFLSWRAWVPLSKLTYSAYLSHYIVLLYNIAVARTASELTTFGAMHTFFGNLCITMFISFVLSSCFEMPFITLSRMMLNLPASWRNRAKLDENKSAGRYFGSTDSNETMGSSREDIGHRSNATSVESVFTGRNSKDLCCISVEPDRMSGNSSASRSNGG